ncbi:MAG: hypothetical protein IJV64_12675 [Oscillospiraceae bacterium]|nr:hypothetical protein [Oscillospiraceae bacterium]
MRKFMAIVLVVVLVFAMASVAFASSGVASPEKGNTNPTPTNNNGSHQTGESFSVVWIILAAVVLLGVAFFCGKKFVAVK